MKFTYEARSEAGKTVTGNMDASDRDSVLRTLRSKGMSPMSVEEAGSGGLSMEINIPGMGAKVKTKDLAIFSRQFATMVAAGLPMLRALTILADQAENAAMQKILADIRKDVEAGKSLTAALKEHKEFPKLYVAMVRAGETAGMLEQVLERLADTLESEVELKGKIKSAMTYPVIVLVMAFGLTIVMLIFIVPTFAGMFETLGEDLPMPTQVLVVGSDFLRTPLGIVLLIGIPTGARFGFKKFKGTDTGQAKIDAFKLKLPVFGTLFRKIALGRFSRNFSVLLNAGVPVIQAIEITAETSGNQVVADALTHVKNAVQSGEQIAKPLATFPIFPPLMTQMIAVGEETGALDTMLDKIADFYEAEVSAATEGLTAMMEPLMIGLLGGIVGGMVIALYLPIFEVIEAVQ